LSAIDGWLADALCRLATGGGLQKRMLFTDDEQNLIAVCRPVAVTGLPDLTSRADLADRAIVAVIDPISKGRREEGELWAAFDESAPAILGALLGGVSHALRDRAYQSRAIKEKPRMADFAVWAAAAMPAFGWTADDFLGTYKGNRDEAVARVLEADSVAEADIEFARQAYSWEPLKLDDETFDGTIRFWKDTATTLLVELAKLVPEDTRRERSWPKDATRLSGCLRRAAPALRTKRIKVDFLRERLELPGGHKGEKRRMVSIAAPAPEGDVEGGT
jgi:putative DNA primase/helicase